MTLTFISSPVAKSWNHIEMGWKRRLWFYSKHQPHRLVMRASWLSPGLRQKETGIRVLYVHFHLGKQCPFHRHWTSFSVSWTHTQSCVDQIVCAVFPKWVWTRHWTWAQTELNDSGHFWNKNVTDSSPRCPTSLFHLKLKLKELAS